MPNDARSPGNRQDRPEKGRGGSEGREIPSASATQPRARQTPSRRSSTRTSLEQRREARHRRRRMDGLLLAFPRKAPDGTPGEIRVMVVPFADREVLHVRHWQRGPKGEMVPTQRGVTIPLSQIAAVRHALERAEEIMHGAEDERSLADVLEDDEP